MGEWSEFNPGDKVPNDDTYIEIGEASMKPVNDPRMVELRRGQRFPETSNKDRKWKKMKS